MAKKPTSQTYIKNKDGTFAGSIGAGKAATPKPAPAVVPEPAGYLDPNEGRGQIIAMAAGWQQLRVQEEVHTAYENIDRCLNGSLPDWQMQEKIDRHRAMARHLTEEQQYRQAEVMTQLVADAELALWAKEQNEAAQAEDDEPAVVEIHVSGMYHRALGLSKDAAWQDLAALDDTGAPRAARSIDAYDKYGKPATS